MALLRSDILNRDFIEKVLRQCEGTSRVSVNSLRVGKAEQRGSLLEERLSVGAEAVVKGRTKEYEWIAKVLRPEAGPANYARFQGILETEVNVYTELLPELRLLKAPLPRTFEVLWGDCKTLNREILLLEEPVNRGFESALSLQKTGLDLGHVILVVEWLAKFHALSYVLMRRHEESKKQGADGASWLDQHPWIRKNNEENFSFTQMPEGLDEKDLSGTGLRARLMTMVAACLKSESNGDHKKIESLLERQDWLDSLRQHTMQERGTRDTDFVTLCHGEPWIGSIYFKFDKEEEENKSQQQRQQNSSQNDESQSDEKSASSSPQAEEETDSNQMNLPCPIEVVLSDFHACSIGRPGIDIAHFLLTSTTREFRKNHLETVLQIYLTELEDIVISQGYAPGFYTPSDLRTDYRRGLVMGITFCLFAMPMLSGSDVDEVDAGRHTSDDVPGGLQEISLDENVRDRILDGLADVADMMEDSLKN